MTPASDFEDTLDALEQERTEQEQKYFETLQQLRSRCERLVAAARAAEGVAAEWVEPGQVTLGGATAAAASRAGSEPAGQEPWPSGGGWLRRQVNGIARWLMRDYIATLDRRHVAIEAALAAQARRTDAAIDETLEVVEALRAQAAEADEEAAGALAASAGQTRRSLESLREALNRCAETADVIADLAERGRLLGDAKDAENLQRAAHGPLRKMELMFDEFGRQQEALLAELVGRRQELDALVARVARRPEDSGG